MTRDWMRTIKAAQEDRVVLYDGHLYPRIPYGQEQWWGWEAPPQQLCGDCGCKPGQLHVTACDVEECPICQPQQRLSCHHWWELQDNTETLMPDNDDEPITSMGSLSYCENDNCASYTDEEHEAIMEHAVALSEALEAAIDAYADAHPELTFGMILHALDCTAYCVKENMHDEEDADA